MTFFVKQVSSGALPPAARQIGLGLLVAMLFLPLTAAADYPADPHSDLAWPYSDQSSVLEIQNRFNAARTNENRQPGISVPMLELPPQTEWTTKSDAQKALWLVNRERVDRGLDPFQGLEKNVMAVAQSYAQYLLDHDVFSHTADGQTPWERLDAKADIAACHDFLSVAENLAVLWGGWTLPIERAVYNWMYDDSGSNWGHRHAMLWFPYNDNSGLPGREGFLGIGRATGTHKGYPGSDIIVMNVFDPCSTWTDPDAMVSIDSGLDAETGSDTDDGSADAGIGQTGPSENLDASVETENSNGGSGGCFIGSLLSCGPHRN